MSTYLELSKIGRTFGFSEGTELENFIRHKEESKRAQIQHEKELQNTKRTIKKLHRNVSNIKADRVKLLSTEEFRKAADAENHIKTTE